MKRSPGKLLLAFYGDDFTGSTDALESLSRAGARTVLFMETPDEKQIGQFGDLDAFGIAGVTRSMAPLQMEETLRPSFRLMKALRPKHVHYKVCSTFDSSPAIGSIGKAIEVGREIFPAAFIPLLVAAPGLGRYCAFGNLFARMGIGSSGSIFRLDRHPSMSRHPVTPADESDLRVHLARQTSKKIGLIDILQVDAPPAELQQAVDRAVQDDVDILLFDAIYPGQMGAIGAILDGANEQDQTLFSVGSSGIGTALTDHWIKAGVLEPVMQWPEAGRAEPLLVVSGSCSPVTAAQIQWAIDNGFATVALDTEGLITGAAEVLENAVVESVAALREGVSVLVHTCKGPDDIRVKRTAEILVNQGVGRLDMSAITSKRYGEALGLIARSVLEQHPVRRLIIAGGDTSGFVAKSLGISAVEMIAPLAPGAPLCRAYAPGSPVDRLEVNFKGGQVGGADYFGLAKNGR